MALRYDCEGILGTIEWAHSTLAEHEQPSGYAMDKVIAKYAQRSRSTADSRQGLFARYLRGDNVPRWRTQADLDFDYLHVNYLSLPLLNVLRVGLAGYREKQGAQCVQSALDDLQGRFERRITRYEGAGLSVVQTQRSKRFGLDLCAYGSCHAVAVLLAAAMEAQDWDDCDAPDGIAREQRIGWVNPLLLGQRAFQCLMLAFAANEFPMTAPLVAARVRQQVLDQLNVDGDVLDTAAVDIEAAVAVAREALEEARGVSDSRYKQRAFLRSWLKSADQRVARLTPAVSSPESSLESRQQRPVSLAIRSTHAPPRRHVSKLGKRATAFLLSAMDGYVALAPTIRQEGQPSATASGTGIGPTASHCD